MTLTECKEFMRLYQRGAEGEQYNWRTTARWALRHKWAQEENGQLRDALAAARDELASMTVRMQIAEDGRQIETRRAERALDTLARYEQQQWMARAIGAEAAEERMLAERHPRQIEGTLLAKEVIRSAPGLPADYMMVRKDYLTELHRNRAQAMATYRRLHKKYVSAARELNHFQQDRQRMYWESRCRREAGEALSLDAECDTLRATLAATRAELDRVMTLAVEDRKRLQDFARGALLNAMVGLSEHHWCAGWLTGTEYFLWSAVESNQPVMWGMDELRQGDIDNLCMLRELAGGWWIWADEEAGEKFVGLDEMRQMAEAMQKIGASTRG